MHPRRLPRGDVLRRQVDPRYDPRDSRRYSAGIVERARARIHRQRADPQSRSRCEHNTTGISARLARNRSRLCRAAADPTADAQCRAPAWRACHAAGTAGMACALTKRVRARRPGHATPHRPHLLPGVRPSQQDGKPGAGGDGRTHRDRRRLADEDRDRGAQRPVETALRRRCRAGPLACGRDQCQGGITKHRRGQSTGGICSYRHPGRARRSPTDALARPAIGDMHAHLWNPGERIGHIVDVNLTLLGRGCRYQLLRAPPERPHPFGCEPRGDLEGRTPPDVVVDSPPIVGRTPAPAPESTTTRAGVSARAPAKRSPSKRPCRAAAMSWSHTCWAVRVAGVRVRYPIASSGETATSGRYAKNGSTGSSHGPMPSLRS